MYENFFYDDDDDMIDVHLLLLLLLVHNISHENVVDIDALNSILSVCGE